MNSSTFWTKKRKDYSVCLVLCHSPKLFLMCILPLAAFAREEHLSFIFFEQQRFSGIM